MCKLCCLGCLFCCADPNIEISKDIANETLRKLEEILQKDVFPVDLATKMSELLEAEQTYQPKLTESQGSYSRKPVKGPINDIIFEKLLLPKIQEGIKASKISAGSINSYEVSAISIQLTHYIILNMLTDEKTFKYHEEFFASSSFNISKLPTYTALCLEDIQKLQVGLL